MRLIIHIMLYGYTGLCLIKGIMERFKSGYVKLLTVII